MRHFDDFDIDCKPLRKQLPSSKMTVEDAKSQSLNETCSKSTQVTLSGRLQAVIAFHCGVKSVAEEKERVAVQ